MTQPNHGFRYLVGRLVTSSPCLLCLEQMMLQNSAPIEENSWRHRRLRSELKALQSDPPEGIQGTNDFDSRLRSEL